MGREFNTIAVDDGIAMGHDGMLYSLPSREIIADSVEYMVNAHAADARWSASATATRSPRMLLAALRLNIPTVFVSGGPMEAGNAVVGADGTVNTRLDLIDAMIKAVDQNVSDADIETIERSACPTCGSCSGMFTASLDELPARGRRACPPGNGSTLATAHARKGLFERAGRLVVELAKRWYDGDDASVLPRSIVTRPALANAMRVDIAMGGSTNTILHLLAAAQEAEVDFDQDDIDALSRVTPCLCKVAPNTNRYYMEDVHRAGGIVAIMGELDRAGMLDDSVHAVHAGSLREWLDTWDIRGGTAAEAAYELFHAAPGGVRTTQAFSTTNRWRAWTPTRRTAASARSSTRTPSTAAWRC